MAKRDIGSDRSRDRYLDNGLDMEEKDDLFLEDPFGEGGVQEGNGRSPSTATKKNMTETAKGMAEGALGAIQEELERKMPNVVTIKSELSDSLSDFRDLKDEISKELQPMMLSMENTTRKILPRAEKLMPKSWYNKLKKTLDDRAAERSGSAAQASREQERADLITQELSTVFEQQAKLSEHNEFEAKKQMITDRALGSIRHKTTQHALTRIYDSMRSTELFHRTLHTAYMRKSLELQYKHLFVAQDTHNLLSKSLASFEEYFKGIVKNTGLPDVMKTQASDYIKKSRTEKYGMMMSDYLMNARKMIFEKVKRSVKDMVGNLGFAAGGADMMADSLQMADEMAEMGGPTANQMLLRQGGGLLGKLLAAGPVRRFADKFLPYTTTINGELENVKTRAYMGLDKIRKDWAGKGPIKAFLSQFLPSMAPASTASNDLLDRSEEAVAFDKMTRASIVEIIPGYLGKILYSIDQIRDPKNAKEQTFNFYKRDFTSVEDFRTDMEKDPRLYGNVAAQTDAVAKTLSVMKTGSERLGDEKSASTLERIKDTDFMQTMSRIISNHATYAEHFDPEKLADFVLKPSEYKEDTYINHVSTGIEFGKFWFTVDRIVHSMQTKDGKFDFTLVRKFADAIHSVRTSTDGLKERMPWLIEHMGQGRFLRNKPGQEGLLNDDRSINMAYVSKKNSKIGTDKAIDEWSEIEDKWLKEYLVSRDFAVGNIKEKFQELRGTAAGKFIVDNYNKARARMKRMSDETDKIALGKENKNLSQPTTETAAQFGFGDMSKLKITNKKDRAEYEAFVAEANAEFARIDAVEDMGPSQKAIQKSAVKSLLVQKHAKIIKKVESQTGIRGQMVSVLRKGLAFVGLDDKTIDALVPTNSKAALKNLKKLKKNLGKKVDKFLDGLPQSEEDCDKIVADATAMAVNAWKATSKDKEATKKFLDNLYKRMKKNHPEAAEKLEASLKFVEDKYEEVANSRAVKSGTVIAKYTGKKFNPYLQTGLTYAVSQYKKAKAFADPYINAAIAKTGLDPEIVRKAASGDEEARETLKRTIVGMAKEDREEIMKRLSKDRLAKDWMDVKAFVANMPETADEAVHDAAKKTGGFVNALKDFGKGLKKSYREGAGLGPEEPEDERVATAGDSSELIDVVKAFHGSVSAEHNALVDSIEAAIASLKNGIPSVSAEDVKKADNESVSKAFAIIRKRYGLFGRGGHVVGQTLKGIGKAGLWGLKKAAGLYASTYNAAMKIGGSALAGVIGGIRNVGGWLTNSVGISPYVDIYIRGQETKRPILTAKKQAFGKGVVFGEPDGDWWKPGTERVMASKDIAKRGVPIFDGKTGKMLIEPDDLEKGLWAAEGPLSQLGRVATAVISGGAGIYGNAIKAIGAVAKVAAEGIFGKAGKKAERYEDVYRKDEVDGKPLITRRQQIKPGVFFRDSGKRVERTSDITEPVMDKNKQILVDDEDIKHGLVNVDNKPLGSSTGGFQGLLGKGFDLGQTIAKGIFGKTGLKIIGGALGGIGAMYKGLFDALLGGGKAVGRGIANIGARIFGFDTPNGFGRKAFDGLNSRLDKIIALLSRGVPTTGGGTTLNAELGDEETKDRGRRGYWGKDGKFHPNKRGNSYENDGPDHPGGAKSKANASSKVEDRAAKDHKETSWKLDPESDGSGEDGEEGSMLDTALDVADWLPGKWGRKAKKWLKKPRKWKNALKAKKARALKNAKKAIKSGKGLKGALKGAKEGFKGTKKAVRVGRSASKAAKAARTASKLRRAGKLGKVARLARFAKLGKVGAALGTAGLAMKGGLGRAGGAVGRVAGAVGLKSAAKFLGPAATIGLAAYDAYDGWNNAGQRLGKDEKDVTTADRAGVATSGVMNGMSLGLANYIGDKIYGEGAVDEAYATIFNDPSGAAKATWNMINPWSSDNQKREKEEADLDAKMADVNKRAADNRKKIEGVVANNLPGVDIGPRTSSNIGRLFSNFMFHTGLKKDAETQERIKKAGGWFNDPDLVKKFCDWLKEKYPPTEDRPKERLAYFEKLYHDPKRVETKREILKLFRIDHPMVKSEWDTRLKELQNAADGNKPDAVPKTTDEIVAEAMDPMKALGAKSLTDVDLKAEGQKQAPNVGSAETVVEKAMGTAKAEANKLVTKTDKDGNVSFDFGKPVSDILAKSGLTAEAVAKMPKDAFLKTVEDKIADLPQWKEAISRNEPGAKKNLKDEVERLYEMAKSDPKAFESVVDAMRWRGRKDANGNWIKPDGSAWMNDQWINGIHTVSDHGGMAGNEVEGWQWDDKDEDSITKWENGQQRKIAHKDLSDPELLELMQTYDPKAAKEGSPLGRLINSGRDRALSEFKNRLRPVIEGYIKSIGGEDAVRKMTPKEFQTGLRAYAKEQGVFDRLPPDTPYQVKNMYSGHLAKLGASEYRRIVPETVAPEMSDLSRDLLTGYDDAVKEAQMQWGRDEFEKIKPPIDTANLTPPKTKDVVSANELALESGMIQKNQTNKVTSAIQANKPEQMMSQQQVQELLKSTQKALMGYSKFSEQMSHVFDKDGLKVAGIPELTAITAAKPAGNTTIVQQQVAEPVDTGLDLRKKQM